MKLRVALLALMLTGTLGVAGPAAAAPPAGGSFTTTLTVEPTVIDGTTVSGFLTADVTQFRLQDGRLVAIATVSGTLTATHPELGTGTIDITGSRVVLNAQVTADCAGHLHIDFTGVLQLDATVTLTTTTGEETTKTLRGTLPLRRGSFDFTTQDPALQALICDISNLLSTRASGQALVDKLNTLLKRI